MKLIANVFDKASIANDLKCLEDWEKIWLLEFNLDKCKVLHIEMNNNQHLDYTLKKF